MRAPEEDLQPNAGFPKGFLWGAATSAYQIEGSPLADGAGPSNWHRFAHRPGTVTGGENGDLACDHYNRYAEDVALMRSLSLNAYRFSVSWSRVLPEGFGRTNEKGLDFYRRLVDALLGAGIEPFGTLFHWDLPAGLEDRGGFLNRDIAGWFADYANLVCRGLPGVSTWATLNEPWVVMDGGYVHGIHAPGHRNLSEAPVVAHNLLRAHAAAVSACRAEGGRRVGLVVNLEPKFPASGSAADAAAAARADAYMNRQFLDPVFFGRAPEELPGIYGEAWPLLPASDFDVIRTPIDFLGVNYYTRSVVRDDPEAFTRASRVRQDGSPHTEMDWEVYAPGLLEILTWVRSRYGALPLYVTENGAAFPDPARAGPDDVADPLRVAYLRDHLRATREAIARGVDVRGYFAWSLLDNFEWSYGFSKRFGIVHVDRATQKRIPKASARFFADVIRSAGASLDAPLPG
ncbi:MAG TPA: GH1 family beta-glucosidase [Thermoanaerobaculia bacterium]|nr:GH1 family beta-glucosidase [Thermoanaerobaculia bacterium]